MRPIMWLFIATSPSTDIEKRQGHLLPAVCLSVSFIVAKRSWIAEKTPLWSYRGVSNRVAEHGYPHGR